jgi:hypothetical protein
MVCIPRRPFICLCMVRINTDLLFVIILNYSYRFGDSRIIDTLVFSMSGLVLPEFGLALYTLPEIS